jgi:hypothetical protein
MNPVTVGMARTKWRCTAVNLSCQAADGVARRLANRKGAKKE